MHLTTRFRTKKNYKNFALKKINLFLNFEVASEGSHSYIRIVRKKLLFYASEKQLTKHNNRIEVQSIELNRGRVKLSTRWALGSTFPLIAGARSRGGVGTSNAMKSHWGAGGQK